MAGKVAVLRLAGVVLHRSRLVAVVLELIDAIGLGEGATRTVASRSPTSAASRVRTGVDGLDVILWKHFDRKCNAPHILIAALTRPGVEMPNIGCCRALTARQANERASLDVQRLQIEGYALMHGLILLGPRRRSS